MTFIDVQRILLAIVIFVPLERLFALHRGQKIFRHKWQLDTIYLLLNPIIIGFGLNLVVLGGVLLAEHLMPQAIKDFTGSQPLWLQIPAVILLSDLIFYGMHRMFHKVPALWKIHAVHHSIEHLDWLAGHRVHPIDQIMTKGASLLPAFVFGFSEAAIAANIAFYGWQSILVHSNTRFKFGPLEHIIATPHFHHWHHANQPEAFDKNFAGQLSFLDWLFGTKYMPAGKMPDHYGTDEPVAEGYAAQIVRTPVTAYRTWRGQTSSPAHPAGQK